VASRQLSQREALCSRPRALAAPPARHGSCRSGGAFPVRAAIAEPPPTVSPDFSSCLLYTSDAADDYS
jgi:hypothetical protein